jgi:AbrB family looped-hinge helix DNA binding protein
MGREETAIAVVGTKGQIVIPKNLRSELQITAKTKLAIYRKDDKLVVTKLSIPPLGEELTELFREIDGQNKIKKKPAEKEIQARKHEKKAKKSRKRKSG